MLRVILAGRQSGKTTRLVDWVKKGREIDQYPGHTRIIVTIDEQQANFIRNKYGLMYHQVFSWSDYRTMRVQYNGLEVGVDNLDAFIANMFSHQGPRGAHVVAATMFAEKRNRFIDD